VSTRNTKILAQVKASFLTLCQQYEVQGKLLNAQARAVAGESQYPPAEVAKTMLKQYNEIGEQLKTLGTAIDLLGGRSVLTGEPAMRVVSGTRKELKRMGIDVPKGSGS